MTRVPAIVAEGLSKDFGGRPALATLDLVIGGEERVAVIGHNGSGKSTLLRLAAGLLEPTSGSILVHGRPAGSLEARRAVAYLADTPTFYSDLSVWEHLEYVARLHGVDDWQQRASDLLDHVGLFERADDLPTRFSRGLRQKAAICLAFVRPFAVLLVDEPFVGLDASGRAALVELLDAASALGAAVVVATHEVSFAATAPRVVALSEGQVVLDGPPGDTDLHTFLG
jgi:ABC-type multidrug transport system ATPase subunit